MMPSGAVGVKETLEKIQSEHLDWTNRNFPGQIPEHPMLGIVEEYGEFCDSVKAADKKNIIDALCDMVIFTVSLANHFKVDAGKEFFKTAGGATSMRSIQSRIGKLAHAVLKSQQNIRKNENHKFAIELNIGLVLEWVFSEMKRLWLDPKKELETVWGEVSKRDWTGGA